MIADLKQALEHSGSPLSVTFGGLGHFVANQSSMAYQSLPVQFLLAQLMGAKALQKQSFVSWVQPIAEEWYGKQEPIAH
jgi:hypothetical protein